MTWIIVIAVLAVLFFALNSESNTAQKSFKDLYKRENSELKRSGTYVSGHPLIDKSMKETYLLLDNEDVKIFTFELGSYKLISQIPKTEITNVSMEDSSTIQNRVTVGRLLLTGVFAFAWKKKTKQECAYFIIDWNKGQFKNETIFEFEGQGSIQKANTLRNSFIHYLSAPQESVIDSNEEQIYLDLISKGRKVEAVNLYMHKNKVRVDIAQNYIEKLAK
jgi:hypothetical protein